MPGLFTVYQEGYISAAGVEQVMGRVGGSDDRETGPDVGAGPCGLRRMLAFILSKVGAMMGSEQKRDVT